MSDLREVLERRAAGVATDPSPALATVLRTAHRRSVRRRLTAAAAATLVLAAALSGLGISWRGSGPAPTVAAADNQLVGSGAAMELREKLGIQGPTKGAPGAVLVERRSSAGTLSVAVVQVRTGQEVAVPTGRDATISPDGSVVAGISENQLVLTPTRSGRARPVAVPVTNGTSGRASWGPGGNALYAPVVGGWVRISNTDTARASRVQRLDVPSIPGGPLLLSVSPSGAVAALFGITYTDGGAPLPHLALGDFDGRSVTNLRAVDIPAGALSGPLGWLGDNAFLLAPGEGQGLIVRTDGSEVSVDGSTVPGACPLVPVNLACQDRGPWLIGTNADGSLLFWQVSAAAPGRPAPLLVVYYRSWLDGTHVIRLTGTAGRFGPPVAAR